MVQKIKWVAVISVLLVAFFAAYIWRSFQPGAFVGNAAYRLTADAVIDGRSVRASQVYTYSCTTGRIAGGRTEAVGTPCLLTGQALRLDLGARGSLFITMNGWNADHSTFNGPDQLVHQLLFATRHGDAIPSGLLPVMVKFGDIGDPATARVVDPAHLDRSFGPGVTLTSVTLNPDVPHVEPGDIDAVLPWLKSLKGKPLSARTGDPALRLHDYDFKWPPIQ